MTTHDQLLLWHALYELEARYWHEVDFNGGRNAHEFFTPDGLMVVGDNRFEGREKILQYYQWRERQAANAVSSVKTTRHLINNLYLESSGERCARALGIISFYGAAVLPPAGAVQTFSVRQARPTRSAWLIKDRQSESP